MCTQSHLSLHCDLIALKNLSIHRRSQRERHPQEKKPRDEEKVFNLKLASISSPSLSDPSFLVLKKKKKLLSRRSSGIESVSIEEQTTMNINSKVKLSQIDSEFPEHKIEKC